MKDGAGTGEGSMVSDRAHSVRCERRLRKSGSAENSRLQFGTMEHLHAGAWWQEEPRATNGPQRLRRIRHKIRWRRRTHGRHRATGSGHGSQAATSAVYGTHVNDAERPSQ